MGEPNVGKSSIIERIIYDTFNFKIDLGGHSDSLDIYFENSLINIYFYDNFGQAYFRLIREQYYPKSNGIILVYDITNRDSFEQCISYYNERIKTLCSKNIKKILLGNKCDLNEKRVITTKEGLEFALENGFKFKEISCKSNQNVFGPIEDLIIDIHNELIKDKPKTSLKLNNCEII